MRYLVGLVNRVSGIGPATVPRVMLRVESRFAPVPNYADGAAELTSASDVLLGPTPEGNAPTDARQRAPQSRLAPLSEGPFDAPQTTTQPGPSSELLVPRPRGAHPRAQAVALGSPRSTKSSLRAAALPDPAENDKERSSDADLPFPESARPQASRGQITPAAGTLKSDGEAPPVQPRSAPTHVAVDSSAVSAPTPLAIADAIRADPMDALPAMERMPASDPKPSQRSLPEGGSAPIHVKIGRIEVRAVAPPPPSRPAPRARPKPGLSLSDYLTQHKRGIP